MDGDELEQWFEANKTTLAGKTGAYALAVSRETLMYWAMQKWIG